MDVVITITGLILAVLTPCEGSVGSAKPACVKQLQLLFPSNDTCESCAAHEPRLLFPAANIKPTTATPPFTIVAGPAGEQFVEISLANAQLRISGGSASSTALDWVGSHAKPLVAAGLDAALRLEKLGATRLNLESGLPKKGRMASAFLPAGVLTGGKVAAVRGASNHFQIKTAEGEYLPHGKVLEQLVLLVPSTDNLSVEIEREGVTFRFDLTLKGLRIGLSHLPRKHSFVPTPSDPRMTHVSVFDALVDRPEGSSRLRIPEAPTGAKSIVGSWCPSALYFLRGLVGGQ